MDRKEQLQMAAAELWPQLWRLPDRFWRSLAQLSSGCTSPKVEVMPTKLAWKGLDSHISNLA